MRNRILISGNEAIGEGAIAAGLKFYAGYPITPQNELTALMARRVPQTSGIFIQAESEISAINMVFGASAAGVRAMTSSSSPGISLKQEGISYIAGAELPVVIANIMRGGPGLGNIAPAQSDYFQATKGGGHGDYHLIVLAPASVQEMFDFTQQAFILADKYRNPVMILADGMLGQMMEPIVVRRKIKILSTKQWVLTGCKGRKPNIIKSFFMLEGTLEKHNQHLGKKFCQIQENEQRYEGFYLEDSDIILVAYGSVFRIAKEAMNLARNKGLRVGLIRPISLWPFPEKIFMKIFKQKHKPKLFLTVEMSSGQMVEDVRLAVNGRCPVKFYGRTGGGIPDEREILHQLLKIKSLVYKKKK